MNTSALSLQILISTINERFLNLKKTTAHRHPLVSYLIVHQHDNHRDSPEVLALKQTFAERADIRVLECEGKGLARSRNICLDHCKSDLALFGDDDIEYLNRFAEKILDIFNTESTDIGCFTIKTPSGKSFKKYSASSFNIGRYSALSVSSVEIAFRVDRIKQKAIRFDERFGLGAEYESSEEAIFLIDCLAAGLRADFFPVAIAVHGAQRTGSDWGNPAMVFSKGAAFRRLFGIPGLFPLLGLALLKWRHYRKHCSITEFILKNLRSFNRLRME